MAKKQKPNILFILIDDLGWQDLQCYGSKFYETPNIDKLRSEGMMFTNAYSACAVCSPTRASILTGKNPAHLQFTGHITAIGRHRYPEHGRIIPPDDKMYVDLNEIMIPEALKSLGYKSISIGKWHVGKEEKYFPTLQGFDINIAGYEHGSPPTYWGPYKNPNSDWNPKIKNMMEGEPGEYLTDRLTDEAIHFIKNNKERPFFIYLSHYAVHTPLEAPDSLVRKYEKKLKKNKSQKSAVYAAMIENMDTNIGRLLFELQKMNLSDNTIIIFYSDNGGEQRATSNKPLREGKGFLYEGGIRVPLIIKWPGKVGANTTCDVPVISDDIYPTIMEIIGKGVKPAKDIDGLSLIPVLRHSKTLKREQLCWYYPHYSPQAKMPGYAIRKGDFKLIEHYDPEKIELFNIKYDINESQNLADSHPEKVNELKRAFDSWLKKMDPVMHSLNPNYTEGYRDE
ncbi:sulfatase [Mariniphaga sediminis]|nr:sulfatase [Mariniphaga sediminis]